MQIFRGITLTYAKAKLIKKKKNIFRGILEKKIEGLLCNNVGIVLMRGGGRTLCRHHHHHHPSTLDVWCMNAVLYIELVIFLLSTGKTQLEAVSFRMSPSWSHGIHTGVTWQCRRLVRGGGGSWQSIYLYPPLGIN